MFGVLEIFDFKEIAGVPGKRSFPKYLEKKEVFNGRTNIFDQLGCYSTTCRAIDHCIQEVQVI